MPRFPVLIVAFVLALSCLTSCRPGARKGASGAGDKSTPAQGKPTGSVRDLPAFLGPLAAPPVPDDNPMSEAKVDLGRMLYYDPRLSGNGSLACATCHNPGLGFADGMAKAVGFNDQVLGRSSPTVLNAAYYKSQFWDGRAPSLEEQAKGPPLAAGEMNSTVEQIEKTLKSIVGYRKRFKNVFGGDPTFDNVAKAIAAFERTVVDQDSPFDRYARGDDEAIDAAARRGLDLFTGKARCAVCHSTPNFTDNRFHNIALGDKDPGRISVSKDQKDAGAFRTPTLRNVALTAPYMHDGSLKTLRKVVDHYERVVNQKPKPPNMSIFMLPFTLTDAEKKDLIAFLLTLTGDKRHPGVNVVPALPQ